MLTRKQHELLMFIHERIKETGVSPSFDEMKEALDLASKSGIHRLITALEERGFLRRLPHRARALEVVKLPQQATTAAPPKGRAPFKPQLVEGGETAPNLPIANDTRELPILGRIAAGTPIEAIHLDPVTFLLDRLDRRAGNHPWRGRAFRPGDRRRLDDQRRHPRRRLCGDPQDRHRQFR